MKSENLQINLILQKAAIFAPYNLYFETVDMLILLKTSKLINRVIQSSKDIISWNVSILQ